MGTLLSVFRPLYSCFCEPINNEVYNILQYDHNIISDRIGPTTFIIVLVIAGLFYFIKRSSCNGWGSWLVVLGITAFISWLVGFTILSRADNYNSQSNETEEQFESADSEDAFDYYEEEDSIVPEVPDAGTSELSEWACVHFGYVNLVISILEFFILSMIFKRFSLSCRHTPWRSLGYVYKG